MAVEMKATVSNEASLLLGQLTEIGQAPIEVYRDLEAIATKTQKYVEGKLATMLQLGHADQQALIFELQKRQFWLDDAKKRFTYCWKSQVSPESYFKDPKDLRFLTANEKAKLEVIERVDMGWTLTDQQSALYSQMKIPREGEIQCANLNRMGEPVSEAVVVIQKSVAKIKEDAQRLPAPAQAAQWQWCVIL